ADAHRLPRLARTEARRRQQASAVRAEPAERLQPEDVARRVQLPQPGRRRAAPVVVDQPEQRRPEQGLRLHRPDQRLGGRRQRLRSALRQGRPLRAGHARLLHRSFPLLSPRGGARCAAVLGLFNCRTKAGCRRASGLFCVRPATYPDRVFHVKNPKTPHRVPEKEWANDTKLALAAAAASGKADDAAAADVTQKLLAMLEALEQKFGPRPGILAARADFLDDPDEAVRLLERAYKIAGQRADVESRVTLADAVAPRHSRQPRARK